MTSVKKRLSGTFIRQHLYVFILLFMASAFAGCHKFDFHHGKHQAKNYPADVAVTWMNMQMRLTKGTTNFNSIVSNRSYAYVGLTLYESIAPGMPGYQSIAQQLSGSPTFPSGKSGEKYYSPASANAALASISKSLFANTTPALISAIDSLEADFNNKFKEKTKPEELQRSIDFGKQIAMAIFEWSKSDGGHEAYNNLTSNTYVPPTGPGLWVPTPPALSKPFVPGWGSNRTFIPHVVANTQVNPPEYSEIPGSEFYKAANEVYLISQQLRPDDSTIAKFWADLPSNFNVPTHAANIVTQLIVLKKLSLPEAAVLYCKHGMAGNDALITCFAAKYKYNLVRPITYIRNVLGHSTWNSLIPTPPYPEYTSAHASLSSAFAKVLEDAFGKNYHFTDYTYEKLYGPRNFSSFQKYMEEASMSRFYGGIHYLFGLEAGKKQGTKVGQMVNDLKFKKGH